MGRHLTDPLDNVNSQTPDPNTVIITGTGGQQSNITGSATGITINSELDNFTIRNTRFVNNLWGAVNV